MLRRRSTARVGLLFLSCLIPGVEARPEDSAPPNFVPGLTLSYVDPRTGSEVTCDEGCHRFEVPAGVELAIRVRVENRGGDVGGEGVAWDLWFDERHHPFPGADLEVCFDEVGRLDHDCWMAMNNRVDWEAWHDLVADVVCVPEKRGVCEDVTVTLTPDMNHEGSRGRGVYSIALWADRFRFASESNEFDNYCGPVRVKVVPSRSAPGVPRNDGVGSDSAHLVVGPSAPQPYSVVPFFAEIERDVMLGSSRSRGTVEFMPVYRGQVTVEVTQFEALEKMEIALRKVLTGEILLSATDRGRATLVGEIGYLDLKDDRGFEVTVDAAHGSRGSRGTVKVAYPSRASYRRTE